MPYGYLTARPEHRETICILIIYYLSVTNYQLPITNYQLSITNYRLPVINYQFTKDHLIYDKSIQ